jgi:hypothetical protein
MRARAVIKLRNGDPARASLADAGIHDEEELDGS